MTYGKTCRGMERYCPIPPIESNTAPSATSTKECSDHYTKVLKVSGSYRVIVCRDDLQWILQRRRAGNPGAGRAWQAIGYMTQSETLKRLWREKTGQSLVSPIATVATPRAKAV